MPTSSNAVVLCRYGYDPLDRLTVCAATGVAELQRFYLKSRLASEIQGQIQRTLMQHGEVLLAQHQREAGGLSATLLASDQQRSVLHGLESQARHAIVYTPYGHSAHRELNYLPGFNGETRDPVTGHYLLGNGYRAFNPVLMRFNSPDNLSPFDEGGINAYAYCTGDPINMSDPTGHFNIIGFFLGALHRMIARWSPTAGRLTRSLVRPQTASGAGAFKRSLPTFDEVTFTHARPAPARSAFEFGSSVVTQGRKRTGAAARHNAVPPRGAEPVNRATPRAAGSRAVDQDKPWTITSEGASNYLTNSPQDMKAQTVFNNFEHHIRSTGKVPFKGDGFKTKKMGGTHTQFDGGALYELDLSLRRRATFTLDPGSREVQVRSIGVHIRSEGSNNR